MIILYSICILKRMENKTENINFTYDYVRLLESVCVDLDFNRYIRDLDTNQILEVMNHHNNYIDTRDFNIIYHMSLKHPLYFSFYFRFRFKHYKDTKCNITKEELEKIKYLINPLSSSNFEIFKY
jgi:hypothetical protein